MKITYDPLEYFKPKLDGSSNLFIYIGGLAVVKRELNNWSVAILEDPHGHKLSAAIFPTEEPIPRKPIEVTFPHGMIELSDDPPATSTPTSIYSSADPADAQAIEKMAIFDSDELHKRSVQLQPSMPQGMVEFRMQGGTGYTARLATGMDILPDLYVFATEGAEVRTLGHWFGIERKVDPNTKITVNNGDTNPTILTFSNNESYIIVLDNVCDRGPSFPHTDFGEYYGQRGLIKDDPINLFCVAERKPISPIHPKGKPPIITTRIACNVALLSKDPL